MKVELPVQMSAVAINDAVMSFDEKKRTYCDYMSEMFDESGYIYWISRQSPSEPFKVHSFIDNHEVTSLVLDAFNRFMEENNQKADDVVAAKVCMNYRRKQAAVVEFTRSIEHTQCVHVEEWDNEEQASNVIKKYRVRLERDAYPEDFFEFEDEESRLVHLICWHSRYNLGTEQPDSDPGSYRYELCDNLFYNDKNEYLDLFSLLDHDLLEPHELEALRAEMLQEMSYVPNSNYQTLAELYEEEGFIKSNGTPMYGKDGKISVAMRQLVNLWSEYDGYLEGMSSLGMDQIVNRLLANYIVELPLYLYDHSGITMNTSGFSCPWDSGQVGFAYVNRAQYKKAFKEDATDEDIEKFIRNYVEAYDLHLRGEVYCMICEYALVDAEDEGDEDTYVWEDNGDGWCCGFYGSDPKENGVIDNVSGEYAKAIEENGVVIED